MPKDTQQPGQAVTPPRRKPPESPAFAAFAAAAAKRKATRSKHLADFNESGAALAAALGLVHLPCLATPDRSARPVVSGKESRRNASKRAEKRQLASAAAGLDNKEIKAYDAEHPHARLKSNRKQNLETAQVIYERAYDLNDSLHKAAHKLRVCSTHVAARLLPGGVCHKTGQALCRSRVCPTCQKALSHKRRAAFLGFFDLNREEMSKFYFYHMVLTLRHSREEDVRDCLYTKYLIERFKMLRGTHFDKNAPAGLSKEWAAYWNKRVAGGIYSIETVPGSDGSPHIHLHVFLLAKMPLWRKGQASEFTKTMRLRWLELTNDSTQVHVEPVYTWQLDEYGMPVLDKKGQKVKSYVTKQHARAGLPGAAESAELQFAHLRAGVAECAKYTLKTDPVSLGQFSDSFLYDLIETRHRYYGRFGCLHSRTKESKQFKELERLNSDFKDLEQVDADALRQMTDPETGEVHLKSKTAMIITSSRNLVPRTAALATLAGTSAAVNEYYYTVKDMAKVVEYAPDADAAVAKALSVTLYKKYSAENDVGATEDEAFSASLPTVAPGLEKCVVLGEVLQAQKSINYRISNRLRIILCPHFQRSPSDNYRPLWGGHTRLPGASSALCATRSGLSVLVASKWRSTAASVRPSWSPF
jgi:hypothetical protein